MKYRKLPVVIEAHQWWKNGDHPEDDSQPNREGSIFLTEGKVVRFYRSPKMDGHYECNHCHLIMGVHGWIDTLEGGHIVCPGDYVITGIKNEKYPCKANIFAETYEKVEE